MTGKRCTAIKRNGDPCAGVAPADETTCWFHRPGADAAEARRAAGRKGAKVSNERRQREKTPADVPDPPSTAEDVVQWTSWMVHTIALGKIETGAATAISSLLKVFMSASARVELLERLDRTERRNAELQAQLGDTR